LLDGSKEGSGRSRPTVIKTVPDPATTAGNKLKTSDRPSLAPSLLHDTCRTDPELVILVTAWHGLPQALRDGILALVKPASGSSLRCGRMAPTGRPRCDLGPDSAGCGDRRFGAGAGRFHEGDRLPEGLQLSPGELSQPAGLFLDRADVPLVHRIASGRRRP
jgi:hypothetical protein